MTAPGKTVLALLTAAALAGACTKEPPPPPPPAEVLVTGVVQRDVPVYL